MAKKKRKDAEDDGPAGAPEWITTFVDMISLLVTFFILLLTFSSLEDRDVLKLTSQFRETDGVLEQTRGDLVREPPDEDWRHPTDPLRGADQPHSRPPDELLENLEEMGQRETPDHIPVDLSTIGNGLRVRYDERCSFDAGSAAPTAELRRSLGELGRVLEHYPFVVLVEGHTDDPPSGALPALDTVAFERAQAAADVLVSSSGLSPDQVQITSRGHRAPRATNETAAGRRLNRRVEIRILPMEVTR